MKHRVECKTCKDPITMLRIPICVVCRKNLSIAFTIGGMVVGAVVEILHRILR